MSWFNSQPSLRVFSETGIKPPPRHHAPQRYQRLASAHSVYDGPSVATIHR